jgi:hypothetical protein
MSLRLRWYIHIERINSERMQNNYVCQKKGRRKMGRSRKKWSHEIEDLKIIRIRNETRAARNRKEWRRVLLEANVQKRR